MFAPKKILVPTDFSEHSDKALKEALDIAKQYESKIYLLHVISVIDQCSVDYCMDIAVLNQIEKQGYDKTNEMFKTELDKFPESKAIDIQTVIRKGASYEEILKEHQEKKIDLIAIAPHGRTGILGHLMGSVAERVLKKAKCPVLLIRN